MPLDKAEAWERHPQLSLRTWKNGEAKTVTFTDEGKDVTTQYGLGYLYLVTEAEDKTVKELWIRPNSPLAIGLSPNVPLKDKTFKITKKTGKANEDTRYTAEQL